MRAAPDSRLRRHGRKQEASSSRDQTGWFGRERARWSELSTPDPRLNELWSMAGGVRRRLLGNAQAGRWARRVTRSVCLSGQVRRYRTSDRPRLVEVVGRHVRRPLRLRPGQLAILAGSGPTLRASPVLSRCPGARKLRAMRKSRCARRYDDHEGEDDDLPLVGDCRSQRSC